MSRKYNAAFPGWFIHFSLLIFFSAQEEKKEHMGNEQEPFLSAMAT